jgi:hypothetical protein
MSTKKKSTRRKAATRKAANVPVRMTAERLIAESRRFRLPGPRPELTRKHLHSALLGVLGIVLESVPYERAVSSPASIVARCLATMIADFEDAKEVR